MSVPPQSSSPVRLPCLPDNIPQSLPLSPFQLSLPQIPTLLEEESQPEDEMPVTKVSRKKIVRSYHLYFATLISIFRLSRLQLRKLVLFQML